MARSLKYLLFGLVLLVPLTEAVAVPGSGTLFGISAQGVLYDLDPLSGHASNPRSTGMGGAVGIAFSPAGTLYALSSRLSAVQPAWLYTLDPITGHAQGGGPTGLPSLAEGDIAFDPASGTLYGAYDTLDNGRRLFALDILSGTATYLPATPGGDISAIAFDRAGALYALDTTLGRLYTLNKATGGPLAYVTIGQSLGSTAGMSFDPISGNLYVGDGGAGGSNLYQLDPANGNLTVIGTTGAAGGLAGLTFVPEPSTMLLLVFTAAAVCRRRV